MNENECFAAIGRKQTELDNLNVEYNRLLLVLAEVASGQVTTDRVSVNVGTRTWEVRATEEPQPPTEEATIQ